MPLGEFQAIDASLKQSVKQTLVAHCGDWRKISNFAEQTTVFPVFRYKYKPHFSSLFDGHGPHF